MIETFKLKLIKVFRNHSLPRWFVLLIDLAVVFLTFLFAYMLRYNMELYLFSMVFALKQSALVCIVYLVAMLLFKSYSGLIRQTTIKDTFILALTNTSAFLVLFLLTILSRKLEWDRLFGIPLSILVIHYGAVTVSLVFFRVFIKMFYIFVSVPVSVRKNVLIYGSGETGIIVKRVIAERSQKRLSAKRVYR